MFPNNRKAAKRYFVSKKTKFVGREAFRKLPIVALGTSPPICRQCVDKLCKRSPFLAQEKIIGSKHKQAYKG